MRERVEDFRDTLWIGVLAIALLVLAAVAAESAPIAAFDQQREPPSYLRSRGYGKVLEVVGDEVTVYQVTASSRLRLTAGRIEGNLLMLEDVMKTAIRSESPSARSAKREIR